MHLNKLPRLFPAMLKCENPLLGFYKGDDYTLLSFYIDRVPQFLYIPGPQSSSIWSIIKQIFNEELLNYKDTLLNAERKTENKDMCLIKCKVRKVWRSKRRQCHTDGNLKGREITNDAQKDVNKTGLTVISQL